MTNGSNTQGFMVILALVGSFYILAHILGPIWNWLDAAGSY